MEGADGVAAKSSDLPLFKQYSPKLASPYSPHRRHLEPHSHQPFGTITTTMTFTARQPGGSTEWECRREARYNSAKVKVPLAADPKEDVCKVILL